MSIKTPKGRLINGALFVKDVFKDERGREGTPSYKIEMAFVDNSDLDELEEAIIQAAVDEWGESAREAYADGKLRSPLLAGDDLAAGREQKGKSGDAYRGMVVIRASTIYNEHGDDAPGGVYVCDEDAEKIEFDRRSKVYNGSYGMALVTPKAYKGVGSNPDGVTLYLNGYQFVEDGDPLRGSVSSLFSPMQGAGSEGKGRRSRGK